MREGLGKLIASESQGSLAARYCSRRRLRPHFNRRSMRQSSPAQLRRTQRGELPFLTPSFLSPARRLDYLTVQPIVLCLTLWSALVSPETADPKSSFSPSAVESL